jgi:hypothetical protein
MAGYNFDPTINVVLVPGLITALMPATIHEPPADDASGSLPIVFPRREVSSSHRLHFLDVFLTSPTSCGQPQLKSIDLDTLLISCVAKTEVSATRNGETDACSDQSRRTQAVVLFKAAAK